MTDLGTLGGSSSTAWDINFKGNVVGWAHTESGFYNAALWTDQQVLNLGTLGGSYSIAYGINCDDVIVGVAETLGGTDMAVMWESELTMELGTLPGGTWSTARGINDSGQVGGQTQLLHR